MKNKILILLSLFFPLIAFAETSEPSKLQKIVEDYFEANIKLNPLEALEVGDNRYNDQFPNSIGPEYRKENEALVKKYLGEIQTVDSNKLTGQDLLTYQIFKRDLEMEQEEFQFPGYLLPLNQSFSTPNYFVLLGSGNGSHPFKTVKDYEDFLGRINGFVEWTDQAIANMKEGVTKGYVQPKALMDKVLPQLNAQIVEDPTKSGFWGPVEHFPKTFSEKDRERLSAAYRKAISEQLIPAYRKLASYVQNEYLPKTRSTVGLYSLPHGREWYAYLVKRFTTTSMSPEEIHRIGLNEVERIHNEMRKVMKEVGFEGDLKAFFTYVNQDPKFYYAKREDLVNGYVDLKARVQPLLPKLFDVMPKSDYEVRAVEEFREQSASGGSYDSGTPDGSRKGIFYVNAYDLSARPKWAMEALSLHEAAPGHHFQISLQQELQNLPRVRRFGGYGAFVEGWGLYAESLGKELGLYQDPYSYFGALNAELWRAIRLVVDTGIHTKAWTREQVLQYMYDNSAVKEARAVSETERYIANPGQALSYKIGQLKIRELRTRAEKELGDRFNIKEFHNQILLDGSLPLDVLEEKINRWIESKK